jgi:diacylglycerol kinase family enzyme
LNKAQSKVLYFIVNLLAGGGKARSKWEQLHEQLSAKKYEINCHLTQNKGHAIELARQAVKEGIKRMYIFGGDGTLNEVLNGVVENDCLLNPDLELIFLTAGSSCDVEKMFPVPQPLIDRVESNQAYLVDVGKIVCHSVDGKQQTRYFLANSSIGVISQAVELFNQKTPFMSFLKRVNIDVAVIYAGLKNILKFGNFGSEIVIDKQAILSRTLKNLTVFKCPYFGGGMNYGVRTAYDDARLHIALMNEMNCLKTLTCIPALYNGTILKKKQAEYHQGNQLEVVTEGLSVAIEADGEIIGYPPCEYSILPKMLRLIV